MKYLAITYIGGGSSYAMRESEFQAIADCVKILKRDWKSVYVLNGKAPAMVHVYEVPEGVEDWHSDGSVYFGESKAPAPISKSIQYLR